MRTADPARPVITLATTATPEALARARADEVRVLMSQGLHVEGYVMDTARVVPAGTTHERVAVRPLGASRMIRDVAAAIDGAVVDERHQEPNGDEYTLAVLCRFGEEIGFSLAVVALTVVRTDFKKIR
ncbi:hypothetical protein [Streptomyces sp. C10-9-1]|uniref:hypothetical protein n=1 Tax=Streptomyces sp. C10-9-1 TaxID=1859285 RepID=UPI003D72D491